MKKMIAQLALAVTLIIVPLKSWEDPNSFRIRAAAFIPQSTLFRKIYHTAGPCVELEYARRCADHIELWGNFDWFWNKGQSVGLCNPTKIRIANFSAGINARAHLCNAMEAYLGIGPSIAGVFLTNQSCFGCEKVSKFAGGFVIKSGLYYPCHDRIAINIFADYIYEPVHFQRHPNVGGIRLGGGLAFAF